MWGFQNRVCLSVRPSVRLSVCLSVCPHPEKRYHHSFVNISPTLVIDTSMERSSRVLHHGNPKIGFFFQKSSKFEFWLLTKSWNHLSFFNISPTLVIDTSMERSSRVLHHGNPKIGFFFQKFEIWILTFDEELKSPLLRQYQSYISNWYINGKVFTSSTAWKPKNLIFFQNSSKFEFWLLTKSWNHLSFVNIGPTLVIDTSMERSSRVLHHGNKTIFFFKVRNWIWLVFWLVLKSWNRSSRSQHAPICRHRGCIVVPLRVDI